MTAATLTATERSQLAKSLTRWTGFHTDAIRPRAIDAAVAPLFEQGLLTEDVIARAQRDDPAVRARLTQAVAVGETYFFRVPEHFAVVRETLAPRWAADPARPRRVWSAGCATGEEAYSIAAVLRARGIASFEVVGTDLVGANVVAARAGRYGPWSLRGAVPPGEDPFLPAAAGAAKREIDPALRACTRFEVHNLLEGPPAPGRFDLVFCRNVLIYFTPEATARALATLMSALAPGGVIAFATMDVARTPEPLVRISAPELQVFELPVDAGRVGADAFGASDAPEVAQRLAMTGQRREDDARLPAPAAASAPSAPPPARAAGAARGRRTPRRGALPIGAADPVALHVRALAHIDRGEHVRARALLADLERLAPEYLPGLLEVALLHAREGRRGRAAELMRSVLGRARGLAPEAPVAGPETLPAGFYVTAARTYLGGEVHR
jgi:chemotaxis protein methyltransferase CheR